MKFKLISIMALLALLLPFICEAQAPTQTQLDAIEKILATQRQKALAVCEADKSGTYQKYKQDVEAIGKESDPERRNALLQKLDANYLAFMRKMYADAKISNPQIKLEVAKVLGSIKFSMDEFGGIQIESTLPSLAPPSKFEQTFNCPFEALNESGNSSSISACEISALPCRGAAFAQAEIAGGARCKADVGTKATVPEGSFNKITITAQSNIFYEGTVFSMFGYGQVNAKFGIRFKPDSGSEQVVHVKEVVGLAPVLWYNKIKGEVSDFEAKASFSGSFQGGAGITAQAHTEVFAISAVLNFLDIINTVNDEIDFLKIEGSN